jgi:predicted CopG family antitoxin
MGTRTITIIDKAYEALKGEKGKDESFSDVVLKLTKRRGRLSDSFGKWKMTDEEYKKIKKEMKKSCSKS